MIQDFVLSCVPVPAAPTEGTSNTDVTSLFRRDRNIADFTLEWMGIFSLTPSMVDVAKSNARFKGNSGGPSLEANVMVRSIRGLVPSGFRQVTKSICASS